MLKPDYFDNKSDIIQEYYQQLEDWIMEDIANRLIESQSMSGTADYRLWKLQQMGLHRSEIQRKLVELTGISDKEVKILLEDAVVASWKDDSDVYERMGKTISNPLDSVQYMRLIDAEYRKCNNSLHNLTNTTLAQSETDLINLLNEAEMLVGSGTQSYSSAICDVLDKYAKTGVTVVEYESGYRRSVESAVETIIRTSMNQTSAQLSNQYINDNDVEYVLVSAHTGARHIKGHETECVSHDYWQGKVFKIHGSEKGYPNLLEATGYEIDSNGVGHVRNKLGLHGINCRHSHQPWDKEFDNPWMENGKPIIDKDESIKRFELEQDQREQERSIRKNKRQLIMKERELNGISNEEERSKLQNEYDKLAYKLREKNERYNDFCKENDLQKQSDRVKVMKFNRSQSNKASRRATIFSKSHPVSTPAEVKNIKETIKQKMSKIKFTPSETIQEAEEYAKRFVNASGFAIGKKNISFNGISIESANEINKTLTQLFETAEIKKFDSIETFGKTQKKYYEAHKDAPFCITNFGNLMINKDICKTLSTVDKYIENGDKAYDFVIANIDKLSGKKLELANTYKTAKRSLVGRNMSDFIVHETGHHLHFNNLNEPLKAYFKNDDWKEYAKKISGYANFSSAEYIAESWNAYVNNEVDILDSKLIEIFEKVIK